jgi:hypothetical protein
MRLRTKWFVFTIGGGVLVAAALLAFPQALFVSVPAWLDVLTTVVFWPVIICEHLVGPGPSIGLPSEHLHEGTPVHVLSAAMGVASSWMFWSSLVFLVILIRTSRRNRGSVVGH